MATELILQLFYYINYYFICQGLIKAGGWAVISSDIAMTNSYYSINSLITANLFSCEYIGSQV